MKLENGSPEDDIIVSTDDISHEQLSLERQLQAVIGGLGPVQSFFLASPNAAPSLNDTDATSSSPQERSTRRRRATSKADLTGHTWSFDVNKKGNPLLFINSYHFRMDKGIYGPGFGAERLLPTNSYNWVCITGKCKVRANTRGQVLYHLTSHEHLHDTQVNESAQRRVEALVYNTAKRSREDPEELIARLQSEREDAFIGVPISHDQMLAIVKRARPAKQHKPEVGDLASLQIPEMYQTTLRGVTFLQHLSPLADGKNRFAMFSTQRNIEYLASSGQWMIDGSFSACPDIFEVTLVVSSEIKNKLIPLVYFLLPNREESTYSACLSYLRSKIGCLHPSSISLDFAPIVFNVLKNSLENTTFQGCYFHFCQALYRRIYGFSDLRQFNNLPATSLEIRKLLALAFVPPHAVQESFRILINDPFYIKHAAALNPLLEYMARTWVGYLNSSGIWVDPLIQLPWNCFYDVIQKRHITKQYVESLHCGFNEASRSKRFDVIAFCDYIRTLQASADIDLDLAQSGSVPVPKELSSLAVKREDELFSLCSSYSEATDTLVYLSEVSKILVFGGYQINTTYDPISDAYLAKL